MWLEKNGEDPLPTDGDLYYSEWKKQNQDNTQTNTDETGAETGQGTGQQSQSAQGGA
jgi:hypothetical protein